MAAIKVSRDEMLSRVARFDSLKASPQAFLDTRIPGHERDIYNVIGPGVTEDPALRPAIADARDFNVTYVGADPGKGAALHSHTTVEVFIPLTGKWTIYWGDEGEEEVVLNERDVISVPPGVMRGFRNAGHEHAYLMAILGGTDAGRVAWAQQVVRAAEKTGLALDEKGDLVERAR
jgi:quercetin dioxygenase-like cupin family protein